MGGRRKKEEKKRQVWRCGGGGGGEGIECGEFGFDGGGESKIKCSFSEIDCTVIGGGPKSRRGGKQTTLKLQ